MPKKTPEKKPAKKVTKVAKAQAIVEAQPESTIESLPTPTTEVAPTVTLETNQTITAPVSSTTPIATITTPTPIAEAPSAASTTPMTVTAVDPTASVITENVAPLSSPISPISMTEPPLTGTNDDFEPEHKGNGMKVVFIFLTALVVGGLAVAGFMYFSPMKSGTTKAPTVVTTPTQAPAIDAETPVASESAQESDLAELSVQILNGSGTAGEASRVRDELQAAGFETFSLGNADSYDYTDTEVQVKEDAAPGIFAKVKEALTSYSAVEKDALPASSDYDIVIIVGKQK